MCGFWLLLLGLFVWLLLFFFPHYLPSPFPSSMQAGSRPGWCLGQMWSQQLSGMGLLSKPCGERGIKTERADFKREVPCVWILIQGDEQTAESKMWMDGWGRIHL